MHEAWEREYLMLNLVDALAPAQKHIQEKMIEMFTQCDTEYGRRVSEGLKVASENITGGLIGSTKSGEAVVQAEEESTEAKPY